MAAFFCDILFSLLVAHTVPSKLLSSYVALGA
jgi:hypothetical protein